VNIKFLNTKRRLAVASVLAAGLLGGGVAVANAAGGTGCATLTYPLCQRSVASGQIVDNAIISNDLSPALRNAINAPDTKGAAEPLFVNATPKVITNIGGTFSTRHTEVGSFVLPKGMWLVNLQAKFNRATASPAGDPEVQPMLQLVGDGNYVTVMGSSISPGLDADLTGSAVSLVTVTADTTFTVNAFGYNSARGSQGSGEITAQAVVVAVRA